MQLYATFCAWVFVLSTLSSLNPFGLFIFVFLAGFGKRDSNSISTVGRARRQVAHSMSLVTPNTNTLNVNNEVTQRRQRSLSCRLPLCPELPIDVAASCGKWRRMESRRDNSRSTRLTFDTVTAFSDLFHVDMRRCHDRGSTSAPTQDELP